MVVRGGDDYLQSGLVGTHGLRLMLPALSALALASAVASGLSDEMCDRIGGKCTFVTTFGNEAARTTIESLVAFASMLLGATCRVDDGLPPSVVAPAGACMLYFLVRMAQRSARAFTNELAQQAAYERSLHAGIWLPMMLVGGLLFLRRVAGFDEGAP